MVAGNTILLEDSIMPDDIRRIDYYYASVPDKAGEGARILAALQQAGINLIGISAFPHGARRSQLDLIPEDSAAFTKAARAVGLKLSANKSGFLIQGDDRPGAVADVLRPLADVHIYSDLGPGVLRRLRPIWRNVLGQGAGSAQGCQAARHRLARERRRSVPSPHTCNRLLAPRTPARA